MKTTRLIDARLLALSIVLSGGIFAVDHSLPLAVAGGGPYVSSSVRSATMFSPVSVAPASAQVRSDQTSPQNISEPRDNELLSDRYDWEVWTTQDGLPENSITSIVQTRDGYLWIGTFGGLARFDGVRFIVFDMANTEALGTNRILSLLEARNGDLWIGTENGGVVRLREGVFASYRTQENAPRGKIFSIVEDQEGGVWFGGANLVRYADETFRQVSLAEGMIDTKLVRSLHIDSDNNLWIATGAGLGRFRAGQWQVFTSTDGLPATRAKFVGQDPQGTLWAAGTDWLAFPRHDRAILTAARGDPPDTIYAATVDRLGNYWIACRDGLLWARQLRENEDEAGVGMLVERALPLSVTGPGGVRSVFEDREGSMWVGTNGRGLLRLRKSQFTLISLPPDIRYKSARFLAADAGGGLWVWFGNQSRRLKNDEWTTVPQLAQMKPFDSISRGPSETLWFAHDGRWLSKLKDGQFTRYEHRLGHIDSILESSQGLVFLGSSNALSVLSDERITTMTVRDGLPPAGVVSLLTESKDGTIWAARDEAVTGYRDGEFVHYTTADGLPPGKIRSMHMDDEANLWIATYGTGLARLRDGKFTRYTTRDGLPDNSLGKILEDDDGNLWINSIRGVFHVALQELNAFAAGRISMINCRSLRTGEGNNAGGVRTPDGRLWFPTIDGLVGIDPGMVTVNDVPPPIVVEWVRVFGKSFDRSDRIRLPIDRSDRIELPLDRRDVVIEYTGLSFVDPDNVTFRYRLIGYDEDWVDAGTRRRAAYKRIPPGTYEFQVQARNNDHVWSEHAATLGITVPAHSYETAWFLVLCGFAVTATLFVGHRIRTQNIRRRNAELRAEISDRKEAERARDHERSLLHALMDHMPDNIYFKDTQSRFTRINKAMAEYFGLDDPADAIGKNDADFFGEEHARRAYEDEQQVMRSGQSLVAKDEREVWPDGRTTWVSTTKVPLRSDDGRIIGTFGISRDITERKQAEEALRESEERFRAVFEDAPVGISVTKSVSGRFVKINKKYGDICGYSQQEMLKTSFQEISHPDDLEVDLSNMRLLLDGTIKHFEMEKRYFHKDGSIVWVNMTCVLLLKTEDDPRVHLTIVQDITDRKRAEEELRLKQFAIDHSCAPIYWIKADGGIAYANKAACQALGYSAEELLSMSVPDFDPDFPRQAWAVHWNEVKEAGTLTFESHHRSKQGRVFPVEITTNHLEHEGQEYIWAYARDITDRKRADAALRESERRLRSVLDGFFEAPIGLCFLDRELRYVFINEWLAKLNGTSVEGHLGRTIREVLPDVAAGAELQLRHVLETGEPIIDGTVEAETPADPGRKHVFQHNYYPVKAGDGTVIGVSCAVQDFTERKRADEQIRKQQHQLEHLSRIGTMGEMATGFAHELNQPLASIVNYTKGCVRRIQAGRPDLEELVGVLNDAASEAQRAGEIIKRIRRFVRKREPARTTIDIAELIRQVLDLMRSDLQRQSIQTRLEVEEHLPTLQGDRIQLQQVLLNLLRNSVEAMNGTAMKHRRLTIGATADNGDSLTLFVRDAGCGLGEVDPDSVFEPFYTTREDGTGMGLAISRTIIEAHGGRLWATENVDGGCTFHFSLPQHTEA